MFVGSQYGNISCHPVGAHNSEMALRFSGKSVHPKLIARSRIVVQKLIVARLINNFHNLYKNPKFNRCVHQSPR